MRKKIFAANWKLNKTPEESRRFLIELKNEIFKLPSFFTSREIIIFPQAFSLEAVSSLCSGTDIGYGPQNIYCEKSGAFTGENSAGVALELGSRFVLIGHSERRALFAEKDQLLNKKNEATQKLGLTPVFCIGETLEQRQNGKTLEVCQTQLSEGLKDIDRSKRIVVAYEPVWAIGTGQVATPAQVAEVHSFLYEEMKKNSFTDYQLLYGGSVKPENASELLGIKHVDGFLIGGAALQVSSFLKICGC